MKNKTRYFALALLLSGILFVTVAAVLANESAPEPVTEAPDTGSPLHPTYALLDADGLNVLESGHPVSTMKTCGSCHDTEFIASHSVHADVGLALSGAVEHTREWQSGVSLYRGWNPISYVMPDTLSIEDWVKTFGWRHVGGGPAVGDGTASEAGVEMNCFLCHTANPDNVARITALESGDFAWSSTATLQSTGIVNDAREYNAEAFAEDGKLRPEYITIAEPRNENCGLCHGVVDSSAQIPLSFDPFDVRQWNTLTTGQVFSPERISNSAMNVAGKSDLARSWDVHAERVVNCIDCHYALNNPVFYVEPESTRPDHLEFDPRRMDFGDYLERPLHQFANGGTDFVDAFPVFDRAVRDCATCHDAESTHTWLEYPLRHMQTLACETCHIPQVYAPALDAVDWTVLTADGNARMSYRGADNTSGLDTNTVLLDGYQPVLMPDNEGKLAPYNVVSAWYWVSGEPAQPVSIDTLKAVYFDGDRYAADVLAVFDTDQDGALSDTELQIDEGEKGALIIAKLQALGLDTPRIMGEVDAYAINHNVTYGEWATKDCATCHSADSLLSAPITIADSNFPGGIIPRPVNENLHGTIEVDDSGALLYVPNLDGDIVDLYVLGHNPVAFVDVLGIVIFLGSFAGILVHGGLRYLAARRMPAPAEPELREVYMYTIYERQWHWLQTAVIFGLIFTGFIIHKPEIFGMFSFRGVVFFHNAFALILVVNAALAAFYHLASGEIKQFLPEPRGFFGQMFAQARYYAYGIFKGEPHPFEKTRNRKMNPIQQVTYFGLLNVLLPLQVITGAMMWGIQHYPQIAETFGGLTGLGPAHTMFSWLMATFIVVHVYMTTTGHTPTANIRAMIFGWDEVEVHGGGEHSEAPQSAGD